LIKYRKDILEVRDLELRCPFEKGKLKEVIKDNKTIQITSFVYVRLSSSGYCSRIKHMGER
jgi:hypothetical protein